MLLAARRCEPWSQCSADSDGLDSQPCRHRLAEKRTNAAKLFGVVALPKTGTLNKFLTELHPVVAKVRSDTFAPFVRHTADWVSRRIRDGVGSPDTVD